MNVIAVLSAVAVTVGVWWSTSRLGPNIQSTTLRWLMVIAGLAVVYVCVPETDHIVGVACALAAAAIADLLLRRTAPTTTWAVGWSTVVWAAAYGASGLSRALIGGLYAVSPLFAVAIASAARRGRNKESYGGSTRGVIWMIWFVSSVVVARTGGISDSVVTAAVSVMVAVPVSSFLTMIVGSMTERYRTSRGAP